MMPQRVTQLRRPARRRGYMADRVATVVADELEPRARNGRAAGGRRFRRTLRSKKPICWHLHSWRLIRRQCLPSARFPSKATDEHFPMASRSAPKNVPIAKVLRRLSSRLSGGLLNWGDLLGRARKRIIRCGLAHRRLSHAVARCHRSAEKLARRQNTLIVQDCFASPLWERADYQFPGGDVRRAGRLVRERERSTAIVPLGDSAAGRRADRGPALLATSEEARPVPRKAVLDDVAREIAYFSAAVQECPTCGIDLKVNQLAEPPQEAAAIACDNSRGLDSWMTPIAGRS